MDCSILDAVPMISLQVRGSEVEPSGGPTCSIALVVSSLEARSPEKPTQGQTHNPILNPCHDRVVNSLDALLVKVRDCDLCSSDLPLGPRPIVQISQSARMLVAGQAPGRKVHVSGVPWDDPSGARLREWMGIEAEVFYDASRVALLPMGFCYPGSGSSGDNPPRKECAPAWRAPLLGELHALELTLVIGRYAQEYHLADLGRSVTETVANWRDSWPTIIPLPHPSPRNNVWLTKNPWFAEELLPALQRRVGELVASTTDLAEQGLR